MRGARAFPGVLQGRGVLRLRSSHLGMLKLRTSCQSYLRCLTSAAVERHPSKHHVSRCTNFEGTTHLTVLMLLPFGQSHSPSGDKRCVPEGQAEFEHRRCESPTVHCTESCHLHSRSGDRPKRNAPEANERESQLLGKTMPHSGQKNQSESRLIPLNSSETALMSFTPNAVWTVTSSRSRATSHI